MSNYLTADLMSFSGPTSLAESYALAGGDNTPDDEPPVVGFQPRRKASCRPRKSGKQPQ